MTIFCTYHTQVFVLSLMFSPESGECSYINNIQLTRHYSSITKKLLHSHYYTDSTEESSAIHREILLSYRLLFGQSSSSRKLFGQLLSRSLTKVSRTSDRHPSTSDIITDDIDPFLSTLCATPFQSSWRCLSFIRRENPLTFLPGSLFPSSALDMYNQLQESDTYSARDDFPIFGPRLLILQRYNMRQQPSRVRDLWRDRRNPLQWYTFWAVLWVGGVSIVLAVLQVLVGVAQIYLTVRA